MYTFVGDPVSVVEGAINAAKVAHSLIDMRKHKGIVYCIRITWGDNYGYRRLVHYVSIHVLIAYTGTSVHVLL